MDLDLDLDFYFVLDWIGFWISHFTWIWIWTWISIYKWIQIQIQESKSAQLYWTHRQICVQKHNLGLSNTGVGRF